MEYKKRLNTAELVALSQFLEADKELHHILTFAGFPQTPFGINQFRKALRASGFHMVRIIIPGPDTHPLRPDSLLSVERLELIQKLLIFHHEKRYRAERTYEFLTGEHQCDKSLDRQLKANHFTWKFSLMEIAKWSEIAKEVHQIIRIANVGKELDALRGDGS